MLGLHISTHVAPRWMSGEDASRSGARSSRAQFWHRVLIVVLLALLATVVLAVRTAGQATPT